MNIVKYMTSQREDKYLGISIFIPSVFLLLAGGRSVIR